jgi:hypothetical protein
VRLSDEHDDFGIYTHLLSLLCFQEDSQGPQDTSTASAREQMLISGASDVPVLEEGGKDKNKKKASPSGSRKKSIVEEHAQPPAMATVQFTAAQVCCR